MLKMHSFMSVIVAVYPCVFCGYTSVLLRYASVPSVLSVDGVEVWMVLKCGWC